MIKRLLIANRGEIAIRIIRTATDLGIETVAVFSEDDAHALHVRHADEAVCLDATGVPAYLDMARLIALATETDCDAIHPGYGFLSESAAFAAACEQAGVVFVGPSADTLAQFGNKAAARHLAEANGVPVPRGLSHAVSLAEADAFLESLGPGAAIMLKAVAGGGGRGMRPVTDRADLPAAFARAESEASTAFGSGELYIEELLPRARHIEVQVVGDGPGTIVHLWDRECSLQRQRQKLIEIAPAFGVPDAMRQDILAAAVRIAAAVNYRGAGTIEFLVDAAAGRWCFMEANARLQVEHTVTEEVTGIDLVAIQLQIAGGATLGKLGLSQSEVPRPRGVALQARVNLETMNADGTVRPGGGTITAYDPPAGPGIRVDGCGYTGYATSPHYDSLLAKVIVQAGDAPAAARKARRALAEFRIEGVRSNARFLQAVLKQFSPDQLHTRYVDENMDALLAETGDRARHYQSDRGIETAGSKVDPDDPLGAFEGRKGGVLAACDAGDGQTVWETKLASPTVFNGLAAAHGRLYAAMRDGSVACFGK